MNLEDRIYNKGMLEIIKGCTGTICGLIQWNMFSSRIDFNVLCQYLVGPYFWGEFIMNTSCESYPITLSYCLVDFE